MFPCEHNVSLLAILLTTLSVQKQAIPALSILSIIPTKDRGKTMSKLPTADQINHINKCIDNGNFVDAIKMLRDIASIGLPRAKHIIELQNNGPRSTMDRAGVLGAYDTLWEYFKSLHVYDSQIDDLHKAVQRMTDQMQHIENERDEYKSRLNAMRTTAGLEPLSTQSAPNPDSGFLAVDPEISVMSSAVDMLNDLNPEARSRVLDYLQRRFE